MNAPYRWLDILVVLSAIAATAFGLLTLGRSPTPLRGKFKFLATLFLGAAFLLGGADSLLTLHYAPRSLFLGTISNLTKHGGKNPTCDLALHDASRPSPSSRANFPAMACTPAIRFASSG